MNRRDDDVEIKAVPAAVSPVRATLFGLAGLLAAMAVLGLAIFHS